MVTFVFSRPAATPAGSATHHRVSPAHQQVLLVAGVRATVLVVQLPWLLDAAIAGPLGPVVAVWMAISVAAAALAAARRRPGAGTEPAVAAVDVAAVLAVTVTAPGGYLPVFLLAVVLLVQVPLRWGLVPALVVGALLCAASAGNPAPGPMDVGSAGVVAVDAAVVALALVFRALRRRQPSSGLADAAAPAITFEHSPAGAALTDPTGKVLSVNPTLALWCHATPQALVGRSLVELVHPGDAAALVAVLDVGPATPGDAEVRLLAAGQERWVRLRIAHVRAAPADQGLCVVQVEDATEHRAMTERLARDARHDHLTGLPNRRALTDELAALVASPGCGGALLMIDLDGFKAVNDLFGHDAGDELLRVVADRLRACLRPGDVAGRMGGDELLVIARDVVDDAGAEAVGHRVLGALVGPASLRAGAVALRASIGVRRTTAVERDPAALTRDADAALYRAKADGGCCVRLARPGEGSVARATPTLAADPVLGHPPRSRA